MSVMIIGNNFAPKITKMQQNHLLPPQLTTLCSHAIVCIASHLPCHPLIDRSVPRIAISHLAKFPPPFPFVQSKYCELPARKKIVLVVLIVFFAILVVV